MFYVWLKKNPHFIQKSLEINPRLTYLGLPKLFEFLLSYRVSPVKIRHKRSKACSGNFEFTPI